MSAAHTPTSTPADELKRSSPQRRRPTVRMLTALDDEILCGMLRIGYMTAGQIRRLWAPGLSDRTMRTNLARLTDEGYIAFAQHATQRDDGPPRNVGRVYIVTPRGEERAKALFPEQNLEEQRLIRKDKVDNPQLNHALRYTDVVLRMLEALPAMPDLIGVLSDSEVRLSTERVPRADGVFVLRRYRRDAEVERAPEYVAPHCVPWLRQAWDREAEEQLFYALEIDNDTEQPRIIREKARSYRTANASMWWQNRNLPFPIPLWIVPDTHRLSVVLNAWIGEWPECIVFGTTWPEIEARGIGYARWVAYNGTGIRSGGRAKRRDRTLFERWLNLDRYGAFMHQWDIALDSSIATGPMLPEALGCKRAPR